MQCTLLTQGMRSIISTVSISPEGFMPFILLLVVIIVTVVIVVVTVILVVVVAIIRVVIVVTIIGVVVVVMIIGVVSRLSCQACSIPIGLAWNSLQEPRHPPGESSVANFTLQSSDFQRWNTLTRHSDSFKFLSGTGSLPSGCVDLTGDEDPTDEDGDIGMGDSTGISASLGGEIFSRRKKYQESNIGNSDNTKDGGKIVGGSNKAFCVTLVEEQMSLWKGNLPRKEVMAKFLEWSSGQATWSGGQDVGVVAKGLEWWPRVLLGAQVSNF
ncbi:hypothetical protein Tco_0431224 [Tanacetum coccineum]